MKPILLLAAFATFATAHEYHHKKDWLNTPEGIEHIGDSHGEIDVDSKGNFYVSIVGGEKSGIQVYSAKGEYIKNLPNARNNHHGFTIVQEDGKDVIYAACLGDKETALLKLATDGEVLLEIPLSAIPKEVGEKFALTHADVAPNSDIWIIDGYRSDRIFIFDKDGKYKSTVAGKGEPWKFKTAHKFAFDTRYDPARVLVCDRSNDRLVHLDLEGNFIAVFAEGVARPCTVDFHGDLAAVAQLASGITILDKEGKVVKRLGANDNPKEFNTNKVAPEKWREGVTTSPHGATFDANGNVVTTEWNKWGRILRWDATKD
ncbi:MAG: 6-bladed beta-propeller [Akkermansiaceae bacterium]